MTTMNEFLFSLDKHQTFTNNVSNADKSNQYSNLNLNQNQNCPILISVQHSNNPKSDKYCDSKVSDKYDEKKKSEAWNKSVYLSLHTITLGDEEKAKKKWKRDDLTDANSSTPSLHISAYENSKEITRLDTLDNKNVELKKNTINMDKQDFHCLLIQNPFEFPRQQEENRARKPEVMGFKASCCLLGSGESTPLNTIRIPPAVADSNVPCFNPANTQTPAVQPNLVSPQTQQQQFEPTSDLGSSKRDMDQLQKQLEHKHAIIIGLEEENGRLQEEIQKLTQKQYDFNMMKTEIEELKERNKKLESESEKNVEAEQKLGATSAKNCDLTVTKQGKERMCAEIQEDEILRFTAQADELKNKNKIYEERIGILEEELKKAEKRAAVRDEDVAPKKAKTRREMRQDLHNFVRF